ncbi:MAG: cytochrome c family protein [Moraxellaceae bacterium]|jgi:mono/diheme cytochrome c family protein|nr:cytochrome c family protein [Moraxellaceae bacterium]
MILPKIALACTVLALTGTVLAEDGKTLYQDHCRKCHGSEGNARTARGYLYFARDFTRPAWQARRSDEEIFRIISEGPDGWSSMPAYSKRLSDAERRALVKVVRDFGKSAMP